MKPRRSRPVLSLSLAVVAFFFCIPGQGRCVSGPGIQTFLQPNQVVDLASAQRDKLTALHVKEGQIVKEGQLLAEFDSRILQAQLKLAALAAEFHGRLDSAKAVVVMRKSRYAALRKLEESGNARPQELQTAQTNLAMAKADLQEALEEKKLRKAEFEVTKAQVEDKKLRSPCSGTVVKINKQVGELVGGVEQQPILSIVQLDPLMAEFHLQPGAAMQLKAEQEVPLIVDSRSVTATVDFISPVIDAQSGTMTVRFRLPNPEGKLLSGSRISYTPILQEGAISSSYGTGKEIHTTANQGQVF